MFSIFSIKNKSNTTNILVNQNDKSHESIVTVEPVEAETSATTSEMLNDLGDLSSGPAQPKTKFPLTKFGEQKRSFNESYYKKHEWVEYSISSDAIFCFACCIFGTDSVEPSLTLTGFKNWKKLSGSRGTKYNKLSKLKAHS